MWQKGQDTEEAGKKKGERTGQNKWQIICHGSDGCDLKEKKNNSARWWNCGQFTKCFYVQSLTLSFPRPAGLPEVTLRAPGHSATKKSSRGFLALNPTLGMPQGGGGGECCGERWWCGVALTIRGCNCSDGRKETQKPHWSVVYRKCKGGEGLSALGRGRPWGHRPRNQLCGYLEGDRVTVPRDLSSFELRGQLWTQVPGGVAQDCRACHVGAGSWLFSPTSPWKRLLAEAERTHSITLHPAAHAGNLKVLFISTFSPHLVPPARHKMPFPNRPSKQDSPVRLNSHQPCSPRTTASWRISLLPGSPPSPPPAPVLPNPFSAPCQLPAAKVPWE